MREKGAEAETGRTQKLAQNTTGRLQSSTCYGSNEIIIGPTV